MLLGLLGTPDRLTETAHAYITLAGLMGAVSETLAPRRGQAASGKEQHVPIAKRRVYGPPADEQRLIPEISAAQV